METITLEENTSPRAMRHEPCIWAGCRLTSLRLLRLPGRKRWVGTCAQHEAAVRTQLVGDAQRLAEAKARRKASCLEEVPRLAASRSAP